MATGLGSDRTVVPRQQTPETKSSSPAAHRRQHSAYPQSGDSRGMRISVLRGGDGT